MKVVIIGCGAQGTGTAGLLAMEPDVETIVLADYSEKAVEKAYRLIESLGEKIKTKNFVKEKVNAGDVDDVARVIKGADICFHAIIPKFNIPIMKACIREKVHYLDLIGLPGGKGTEEDGTIMGQIALNKEFESAGILGIPSIGISPGWTLLAAADMIDRMDEVKEVKIYFADWVDTTELTASINPAFMFSEWFGAPYPSAYKNGAVVAEDLLGSCEEFEFPEPIGRQKVYTCTSQPDIVMIPEFSSKKIPYCVEKGGNVTANGGIMDIAVCALQKAAARGKTIPKGSTILDVLGDELIPPTEHDRLFEEGKIKDHATCFSVEVNGIKDGRFTRMIQHNNCTKATAIKHLPWSTPAVYDTAGGLPVILILMIGRGKLKAKGVYSIGQLGIAEEVNAELKHREHDITEVIIQE